MAEKDSVMVEVATVFSRGAGLWNDEQVRTIKERVVEEVGREYEDLPMRREFAEFAANPDSDVHPGTAFASMFGLYALRARDLEDPNLDLYRDGKGKVRYCLAVCLEEKIGSQTVVFFGFENALPPLEVLNQINFATGTLTGKAVLDGRPWEAGNSGS